MEGGPLFGVGRTVAHRVFHRHGVRWEVWEVHLRENGGRRSVDPQLAEGWLTFESAAEKRRLAPIPEGWADLDEETLVTLCDAAVYVRERGESGLWPRFPDSLERGSP
jgi:hypothetical protein